MKTNFLNTHLLHILKKYEIQPLPLDVFLNNYFKSHKSLGSKDRKRIAETVFGMIRWRRSIDHLCKKNPSWEHKLSTFQTLHMVFPLQDSSMSAAVQVSFPDSLWSLLVTQYGDVRAKELALICNQPAPTTIRINPLKTTREELIQKLHEICHATPTPVSPLGIHLEKRIALFDLAVFKEGHFEMQDEASQLVSLMVCPNPGEQVLDYCAGSGGKTLGFAPSLKGCGQLYLHDIRLPALEQAKKRLRRAGIQNAQCLPPHHHHLSKLKGKLDWVLIDAPCSGTGTLRRNPDMKWNFSLESLNKLVGLQRSIFEKGLSFLKPGGKIVYATCSLLEQENQNQMGHFLQTYPLKQVGNPFCSVPTTGGMDGFFAVTFEKQ